MNESVVKKYDIDCVLGALCRTVVIIVSRKFKWAGCLYLGCSQPHDIEMFAYMLTS